jgi:tetraacyldisaccharide 4'-kinase
MNPDSLLLRWLLFPLSLVFGLLVAIKNMMYGAGLLSGVRFNMPVIGVGNLSVGGAGKTPHVEYLVRLLRAHIRTGVMSRGYGRSTSGFMLVSRDHQSDMTGDEPLMLARKYPDVEIAVSESRSLGIPMLMQSHPELQVILLDDAFQHRSVSPHLNILLTAYNHPFYRDWLLPTGSLREWRSAYKRADMIVVTKCPEDMSDRERIQILRDLRPLPQQAVYFSAFRYHVPYAMYVRGGRVELSDAISVLLVCGIANPEYLIAHVEERTGHLDIVTFEDHHAFLQEDLDLITKRYQALPGDHKIILTTEKDAVRLESWGSLITSRNLPLYLLPVEVVFLFQDGMRFDQQIRKFLLDFRI